NLRKLVAVGCGGRADPGQGLAQILLDVVVQRAKRRDVDDVDPVLQATVASQRVEVIERPEKCRERLAGARRRDDQGVAAGGDRVPPLALGWRRFGEGLLEPAADERQE